MVEPSITDGKLLLDVEGADKIWALKSQLVIPLKHVSGVQIDTEVVREFYHGLKAPGTGIPGVITAGTFYKQGQRTFWDIHHPDKAVIISLRDENYSGLVIQVEDPEGFVAQLQTVLKQ